MPAFLPLPGASRKLRRAQAVAWFLAMAGVSVLAACAWILVLK